MPVQMDFVSVFRPKRVLELGCGFYSTKLYLDNCECVVSIESDSDEWFTRMQDHFGQRPTWEHVRLSGVDNIAAFLAGRADLFDLIFVDGDVWRAEETRLALDYATTVIGHDTQGYHIGGNGMIQDHYRLPSDVLKIDFTHFPVSYGSIAGLSDRPWTSLFTRSRVVFEHFIDIGELALYERYKFPYVYDEPPIR